MYYGQNGNYMQDLNYYNQNPNTSYNPYMQTTNTYQQNNMNMNNTANMGNMSTMNGMNMNTQLPMQNSQNLSAMYPAVYRIISPVVSQVVSNNGTGYLTEDSLNSMVDTVYNIVEGDINLSDNSRTNVETSATTENPVSSNCSRGGANSTSREHNNNYYIYF